MERSTARSEREGTGHVAVGVRVVVLLAAVVLLPACASRSVETVAWEHVRATASHGAALHRWPAGAELTVDVTGLSPGDSAAVFGAFGAWLTEPHARVSVRPARPGEAAEVVFRDVGEIEEGYESMGLTTLEWEGPWLVRAEVELARSSRCGSFLTTTERRRTLLHEVGHVLGLGHSPRLSSIMHRETPGSSVDAGDRAALDLLYAVSAQVAGVAAGP